MKSFKGDIMKKFIFLSFISLVGTLYASPKKVGVGVIIGHPSGISLKHWVTRREAVDMVVGWFSPNYFYIHGEYLYHFPQPKVDGQMVPYVGMGVVFRVKTGREGELILGARLCGGMELLYRPIGLFMELAPMVDMIPVGTVHICGGIGLRFYLPYR